MTNHEKFRKLIPLKHRIRKAPNGGAYLVWCPKDKTEYYRNFITCFRCNEEVIIDD